MRYGLKITVLLACLCPLLLYGQNTLSALADVYSVGKGETWESVAAGCGVSVEELQAANPDMRWKKLKKGMLLIVPKASTAPSPEEGSGESLHPAGEGVAAGGLSPVRTSVRELKVGVLLPFDDGKMVEFYRGLLMAADSIRGRSGVSLDIHAWDSGNTAARTDSLLPQLAPLDILFGPASAVQMPAVCEVCKEQGTRLVLPFWTGQSLLDYPLVYNATASRTVLYDEAVKKMTSYFDNRNYVVVRSGSSDSAGKTLCESLLRALSQQTATPRYLELEADDFAYETAFNQFRDNMIVLDDSSIRSLGVLLDRLKTFRQKHSKYRLSLIGFPEWLDDAPRLVEDFHAFDTYVISPHYYNIWDNRTEGFLQAYKTFFREPASQGSPCYAAFGFDLGCYFLGGVSSLGDTFEQMQGSIQQEPYQSLFRFERSASGMSFTNRFVQFIHYSQEKKIELIR